MKQRILLKLSLFITLSVFVVVNVSAKKRIYGSGNVEKQERTITGFNQISCYGVVDIFLSQGNEEIVIVEADDNLLPYILTENKGGKLEIKIKESITIQKSKKMNIYITIKDLSEVSMYGVGKLACQTELNLPNFKLMNYGVGNVTLKGNTKEFYLSNNGVGNVNAQNFEAENVDLSNSGVGNVKVTATEEIKITNNGVGSVDYYGGAKIVDINSTGVGGIHKR